MKNPFANQILHVPGKHGIDTKIQKGEIDNGTV